MGDADVLAGHQQIVDVGRVEAAERHAVGLLVALVPDPVLESEVVFALARIPGAVDAEGAVVGDQHVVEAGVIADVVLRQHIVALVASELPLGGHEGLDLVKRK